MLSRINFDYEGDDVVKDSIEDHIDSFAREGLRVLLLGGKKITAEEYTECRQELDRALSQKGQQREYNLNRLFG